ncbi:RHS repeat-associated core domain-containing protein [Cohnella fermenti]|uniref:RHS repeat-associated core domain-containing protein n=1 Tax=Cohnella fermenti TaxID=2565925 RepID=A0A4S4C250_9BACL|nr:RHS repeat-associated core domain-containing protein [Cohnella fermenti]THF81686.1 RHS repeat-associated core domain-containing protein [Cohnella fermenti]
MGNRPASRATSPLMQASLSGETERVDYTYDNNGNMISKSTEERKKTDPMNLPEPTFGIFVYGQVTDNPRIVTVLEGVARYEYDVFNQLIRVSTGNGGASYQYNGEGLRVRKTGSDGETTNYMYEYDKVVLETDGNGKQTARNLYGLNLATRTVGTATYSYLYNGHADVTSLTDASGVVQSTYSYDAFGNIVSQTGTINSPFRYAGYQYDDESDLYYLNARYYDPKIARFLSEDTFRGQANYPLSLNLYTYVHNEPIKYLDPTGHLIASDSKLSADAQAQIIALTSAYYAATTKSERDAIAAKAEAVRKNDKNTFTAITVEMSSQVQTIINTATSTLASMTYLTASSWSNLIRSHNVTSSSVSFGVSRATTTTFGKTDINVTTNNIYFKTATATTSRSYTNHLTTAEEAFVNNIQRGVGGTVNVEQAVTLLSLLEQNKDNEANQYILWQYSSGKGVNSSETKLLINGVIASGHNTGSSLNKLYTTVTGQKESNSFDNYLGLLTSAKNGDNIDVINAVMAREYLMYQIDLKNAQTSQLWSIVESNMELGIAGAANFAGRFAKLRFAMPKGAGNGGRNLFNSTNPKDFLDEALEQQGLTSIPNGLKHPWTANGYVYEVRIHPGNSQHTNAGSIYRVSRKSVPNSDPKVQGSGTEYLGTDGKWYKESELKEFFKDGTKNPNFNATGAKNTHIDLP